MSPIFVPTFSEVRGMQTQAEAVTSSLSRGTGEVQRRKPLTRKVFDHVILLIMAMSGKPARELRIPRQSWAKKRFYAKAREKVAVALGMTPCEMSKVLRIGEQNGPFYVRQYLLKNHVTAAEREILVPFHLH